MVIAAHADDIEFNFGGTALKYHERFGYEIVYVMSTNNMSGAWNQHMEEKERKTIVPEALLTVIERTEDPDAGIRTTYVPWYVIMPQRKKECEQAARGFFGTEPIHLNHPQRHYRTGRLESVELRYGAPRPNCITADIPSILTAHEDEDSVEGLTKLIVEKNPEVIITHAPAEPCMEHLGTNLLVRKAFRRAQESGYDGSFICSLTISPMDVGDFFEMYDTFVDISGYYQKKLAAIITHSCQVPRYDHLELRDKKTGERAGVEHAEAFTVAELSRTRNGELTRELIRNHEYCIKHWSQMFFGKQSDKG